MAVDVKSLLMSKWTLAAAGAGGGYLAGKRYLRRKHGEVYGALGGAVAGYIVGRLLEPKVSAVQQITASEMAARASAAAERGQIDGVGDGMGDYVDMDDEQDNVSYAPPGASAYAQRSARVQRDASAAMRPPPADAPENLSDLSEGWNGTNGSLGGGLGDYANDDDLDALIEQARRGN